MSDGGQRIFVFDITYRHKRMDRVDREILLSFWKVHILHHAGEEPIYGQWIITELRRHGYEISPGTLYPLLQRLVRHGWLNVTVQGGGRRARRDYRLTPKGKRSLSWSGHNSGSFTTKLWQKRKSEDPNEMTMFREPTTPPALGAKL
jgi:DNA-binding PadR family transcriptional regulator